LHDDLCQKFLSTEGFTDTVASFDKDCVVKNRVVGEYEHLLRLAGRDRVRQEEDKTMVQLPDAKTQRFPLLLTLFSDRIN
jgi:hypothetical protein